MRFDEIPKFISTERCYKVNYGIMAYIEWLDEEIKDLGLEMNPEFQRGHVWTEEQQSKYMEFIMQGGHTGRDFYFNCKNGAYNKETSNGLYICVDGLQRTTAIRRFLNNEIKVFGQFYNEFDRKLRRTEFDITVYINDLDNMKDIIKWYIEFNEGGTPHTKEEIDRVKKMLNE